MGQRGEQAGKFAGVVKKSTQRDFPIFEVVDRWLATCKQARYSALIAFSRHDMQLNTNLRTNDAKTTFLGSNSHQHQFRQNP